MAIVIKKTLHPSDDVVNQNHAAVIDAFSQTNAVIAATTINGTVNNRITDASLAPGRALVGTGTSFPVPAATNQLWVRTDQGIAYYYDGTRWLSLHEVTVPLGIYNAFNGSFAATTTAALAGKIPNCPTGTIYVTKLSLDSFVATTNNGTNFWTFQLTNDVGASIGSSISTGTTPDAANTTVEHDLTGINSVRTVGTDINFFMKATKTLTPGNLFIHATVHVRLIG